MFISGIWQNIEPQRKYRLVSASDKLLVGSGEGASWARNLRLQLPELNHDGARNRHNVSAETT